MAFGTPFSYQVLIATHFVCLPTDQESQRLMIGRSEPVGSLDRLPLAVTPKKPLWDGNQL